MRLFLVNAIILVRLFHMMKNSYLQNGQKYCKIHERESVMEGVRHESDGYTQRNYERDFE